MAGGEAVVQAISVLFFVDEPSQSYQVLRVSLLDSASPRRFVYGSHVG